MDIKKIMLLEDDKCTQVLLKRQLLKYAPNSIFTVADRKSTFLRKINWFFPDLILADFTLLDFTGLDALQYVRKHKPYIPFVIITGEARRPNWLMDEILELADGFFHKDDMDKLPVELEKIMERKTAKAAEASASVCRQNKQLLSINKTMQILKSSEDFPKKAEIMSLLRDVKVGKQTRRRNSI